MPAGSSRTDYDQLLEREAVNLQRASSIAALRTGTKLDDSIAQFVEKVRAAKRLWPYAKDIALADVFGSIANGPVKPAAVTRRVASKATAKAVKSSAAGRERVSPEIAEKRRTAIIKAMRGAQGPLKLGDIRKLVGKTPLFRGMTPNNFSQYLADLLETKALKRQGKGAASTYRYRGSGKASTKSAKPKKSGWSAARKRQQAERMKKWHAGRKKQA